MTEQIPTTIEIAISEDTNLRDEKAKNGIEKNSEQQPPKAARLLTKFDAFDDWFEGLDPNSGTILQPGQQEEHKPRPKMDESQDCYLSDEDDAKRDNNAKGPMRGNLGRNKSGALERILRAPSPFGSANSNNTQLTELHSRSTQTSSSSGAKNLSIMPAVLAATTASKLVNKVKSKQYKSDRRRNVGASLDRFLPANNETIKGDPIEDRSVRSEMSAAKKKLSTSRKPNRSPMNVVAEESRGKSSGAESDKTLPSTRMKRCSSHGALSTSRPPKTPISSKRKSLSIDLGIPVPATPKIPESRNVSSNRTSDILCTPRRPNRGLTTVDAVLHSPPEEVKCFSAAVKSLCTPRRRRAHVEKSMVDALSFSDHGVSSRHTRRSRGDPMSRSCHTRTSRRESGSHLSQKDELSHSAHARTTSTSLHRSGSNNELKSSSAHCRRRLTGADRVLSMGNMGDPGCRVSSHGKLKKKRLPSSRSANSLSRNRNSILDNELEPNVVHRQDRKSTTYKASSSSNHPTKNETFDIGAAAKVAGDGKHLGAFLLVENLGGVQGKLVRAS